ncbi:MAG: hypothetical protein QMD04_08110 [Anaerolineales bacterium]|nr:hypothetical protein [Anaerolineales bacterium]
MEESPRSAYLNSLNLSADPFIAPVAEQEIGLVHEAFYSYFIFPILPDSRSVNLRMLRQPQHAFIYGEPGSGKTTLRLTLEADCRTVLDGTLAVAYELGEDIQRPLTLDEHGDRLAKALAIDLFIQVIEQFNPLNPFPDDGQIQGLQGQVQRGGRHLKRLIEKILDEPSPSERFGIGTYWASLGKAPVRYIATSDALLELLRRCLHAPETALPKGWEAVWEGLEAARRWGFERALIMIDGVDTRQRSEEAMSKLIEPLLGMLSQVEARGMFFKFFLPLELEKNVSELLKNAGLNSQEFSSIILRWQEETLRNLLRQRFRAANARYIGLNDFAEASFDLDQKVMEKAGNSPRRLLQVISKLIDIHVARAPASIKISDADWEDMQLKCELP